MFPRTVELAFQRFQRHRDPRALAIVFDRTAPELLQLGRHLASPGTDAEDLVQATFVTAIEDAASHRHGERVLPWLVGILVNHARAARRRSRRLVDASRLQAAVVDPNDDVTALEVTAELRQAIDRLPEVYRPVLRLVCEHGLQAQEIARTLERPAGTVRAQITRGIDLLRRALPVSLAGGAAITVASGRGIAAVRTEVLAACGGTATGFLSAVTLGGLIVLHHKVVAALAAVVLVALGWSLYPPEPPPVDATPLAAEGAPASATAPLGVTPVPEPAASRTAVVEPPAPPDSSSAPTTGELVVRVVGNGAPCRGIAVAVHRLDELQNLGRDLAWRTTDADGAVRFVDLAPGQWAVDVDRVGTAVVAETTAGARVERTVTLPGGVTVRGTVRDRNGAPVPMASVVLVGNRAGYVPVATADTLGAFTVEHLQPGLELLARASGRQPSLAVRVAGGGNEVRVDLVLGDAGRTIVGRVLDPDGLPVAGAVVAVLPSEAAVVDPARTGEPQPRAWFGRSGGDGTLRCEEAVPGRSIVFAVAQSRGLAPGWVEVDTGSSDGFAEVRLARGARLEGTIRQDGAPLEGVQVLTWPLEEPRIGYLLNLFGMRYATTGPDGSYTIAGLLPGPQSVRLAQGTALVKNERVELRDGETTTWHAELGGGSGLAVVVEASVPVTNLRLVAIVSNSTLRNGDTPQLVPIQGNGKGVGTGPRSEPVDVVLAHMPGGASLVQLAAVRQVPPSQAEVRFALGPREIPSRSIRGRLVDAQGGPVAGETVTALKASADGLVVRIETQTSAEGAFVLGPLPAGDYMLQAGSWRDARPLHTAVLTADRDEDVGDRRSPRH